MPLSDDFLRGLGAKSCSPRNCTISGSYRRTYSSCILLHIFIFSIIGLANGDNFKFGTIRWSVCDQFADPLFPDVCSNKQARKIGFTISAAWDTDNTDQSMLRNANAAVANFKKGDCSNDGCALLVSRQCSLSSCQYTNERRIGYRRGYVESTSPYADRSFPVTAIGPNAGIGDGTQSAGIINCPIPSTCPGDVTTSPNYIFRIERVARGMVYARFAFELTFPADDRYIVFFEGCCRPPRCSNGQCESNGQAVGINNNAGLPFHIRTGVIVGSDSTNPQSSFRFEMPDLVMLRWNGVPGPSLCTGISATSTFQLQGFHPDSRFSDRVQFRIGTAWEQGLYKCVEHSPILNPNGPLLRVDVSSTSLAQRCPVGGTYPVTFNSQGLPNPITSANGLAASSFSSYGALTSPAISVDPVSGRVTFPVSSPGAWQTTVVADVCLCGSCTGCTRTISVAVDFLVVVRDAQNNPHPPKPDYSTLTYTAGLPGFRGIDSSTPQTIPSNPALYSGKNPYLTTNSKYFIKIQCGEQQFYRDAAVHDSEQISAYSQSFLRIAYRDDDDSQIGIQNGCFGNIIGLVDVIQPSTTLPFGVTIVGATPADMQGAIKMGNGVSQTSQDSRGYIDIVWSPECEDRSQVGVFMMCFEAQDKAATPSQNFLLSTPSAFNYEGTSSVNPSCLFVESLGPKPNPAPEVTVCEDGLCTQSTKTCSEDCCACCGFAGCLCELQGYTCCKKIYASLDYLNVFDIGSANLNNGWGLNLSLTFPCTPDTIKSGSCLSDTLRNQWKSQLIAEPYLAPVKYGCGDAKYQDCVEDSSKRNDVKTQLVWDLDRAVCCANQNSDCSVCVSDPFTTTIERTCSQVPKGSPGYEVTRSSCSKTESCRASCPAQVGAPNLPFKVCVQSLQIVPSSLNVDLWIESYGAPPTNNSCLVCFMLTPQTKPAFIQGYTSASPGPSNVGFWEVAVGKELILQLVAIDSSGDAVNIVLLPSPGAPNGAVLTDEKPYVAGGRAATSRKFVYRPLLNQAGLQYAISFQARVSSDLTNVGDRQDFTIQVATTQVLWTITDRDGQCPWPLSGGVCLPAGKQTVTVGCSYVYRISANLDCSSANGLKGCSYASSYNVSLRMQQLPDCPDCFDVPVSVKACALETPSTYPCCGNGLCDGAETGSNCPSDCEPDGSTIAPCIPDSGCSPLTSSVACCTIPKWTNVDPSTVATFYTSEVISAVAVWSPIRNQQGRTVLNCIQAYDQSSATDFKTGISVIRQPRSGISAPSFCVLLEVLSCQYCVPAKATLRSISKHYLLNVDWLRLYNSNPAIANPDRIISEQRIFLGPQYSVKQGDSLLGIAAETRTTVKAIMQNNPVIGSDGKIFAGQSLCLLLCSVA